MSDGNHTAADMTNPYSIKRLFILQCKHLFENLICDLDWSKWAVGVCVNALKHHFSMLIPTQLSAVNKLGSSPSVSSSCETKRNKFTVSVSICGRALPAAIWYTCLVGHLCKENHVLAATYEET